MSEILSKTDITSSRPSGRQTSGALSVPLKPLFSLSTPTSLCRTSAERHFLCLSMTAAVF